MKKFLLVSATIAMAAMISAPASACGGKKAKKDSIKQALNSKNVSTKKAKTGSKKVVAQVEAKKTK